MRIASPPAGSGGCPLGWIALTLLRTRRFTSAGFGVIQGDDAGGGGGGYGDGRGYQQRLVDAAAAHYMLHRLHRLAGADGYPIDVEFEPRFQGIRGQRMVEAGDAVEVVVGLLYILAMKAGLGQPRRRAAR